MPMSVQAATEFLDLAAFVWYQRFELAPDVFTPGTRDVDLALIQAGIGPNLAGKTVLDIGTTNGGVAFTLEARGASRVVAVDIYPPAHFGFDRLRTALGSHVEFVRASI